MIGLVKPLAHIMTAAVLLGTLGYLCAIFLTITAGHGVLLAMKGQRVTKYLIILVVLAVMREFSIMQNSIVTILLHLNC